MKKISSYVDIDNAREDEQRQVMQEIIKAKDCPFCLDNLHKYHKQPILHDGQFWILTPNQWPYNHTNLHLLAIYKQHVENLTDLDPEAGKELFEIFAEVQAENQLLGGGWAMRFGDTRHSAGTILHLHAQFIVPDVDMPDFQPVRFKVGKG